MKHKFYKIISLITVVALIIFLFPIETKADWYNTSWGYRVKITVDNTKVSSNLTDFPIYLDLSLLPAGFHNNVKSDGSDIRITTSDGETEVPREVVSYNSTTDTGEVHFKGTLSGSADTEFYIYYGNSGASEPAVDAAYGSQNVWTNDFKAVYHLQEDTSGNDANVTEDSTSNGYHLTPSGNPVNGTGKLAGNGVTFDGSNDQLKDTDQVWANADNAITVSMWSNFASADGGQNATIFRYATSGTERNSAHAPWANTAYWDFGTCCTDSRISGSYTAYDDKYSLLHFVSNGSTNKIIYIDGTSRYSNMSAADNPNTDLTGFAIGSGIDAEYHKGTIDEVRVSTAVRTAEWIATEYNNQNAPNTFYSLGSEETPPAAPISYKIIIKGSTIIKGGTIIK